MAEVVELRNEESIPELEAMLLLIFDKDEVKIIINARNELNYKMNRTPKNKDDCYKYIDNELKLLKIVKLRHKKSGQQKNAKITNLELSLKERINRLFIQCVRWFPQDIRVWMTYIKFCQQNRSPSDTGRVMEQMLKVHGSAQPQLFKVAADWELKHCKCVEKARLHLTNGIHLHKNNKQLLKDAFRLELIDAEIKRKACVANGLPIDPTNPHLTSKKAECVYEVSIKKMNDVELLNDLMKICEQYDFTSDLLTKITNDMFECDTNERMWDIIATRELKGTSDDKSSPKAKIGKCVALYETAVKRLNTSTMWAYYLDMLLELIKESKVLPIYKKKLLFTALKKCDSSGKLTEKYYLLWANLLETSDKHKALVEMLHGAVKHPHLSESLVLWQKLLKAHLNRGEERQAMQVFEQGTSALTKLSLPLWKMMLQFEQTKRNNKVEDIFKKSWNACPEVSAALKPMYLEWMTLTHGIAAARKLYDVLKNIPPPCLELHKKMIYLETIQPTLNKKKIRTCHTLACVQFSDNVDVWVDFVKFETYKGDPERVSEIFWNARSQLPSHLVETFLSEFSLVQTIPTSTNK